MSKYEVLARVWENGDTVYGVDDMGIEYMFKRVGDKFQYTRKGLDEWFDISVTNFLNEFKLFCVD